ncbi:hypothetical protein [Streptomyces sp. NPDC046821]|uniref:hypothetical protein n=1 Tax=Streptomyces sp. NPDC046821 TaxID=3154702 RepID=UPI0033F60BD3
MRALGRFAALAAGAVVARAGYVALRRARPGGADVWERTNFAGRAVDLCAGPAVVAGTVAGVAAATSGRQRAAAVLAVCAAGACGAYDDVVGAGDPRRGFRAHLSALRDGELTSGAVKLIGISGAGLVAGALLEERAVDKALAGVVIAGAAHLVNLVDVRPGRAAALVLAMGAPGLLRGALAAAPMGAVAAVLPEDLDGRTMIGDTGAHALGAALGVAVVTANGRAGLLAHAAAFVAAAAYGDRVSAVARAGAG